MNYICRKDEILDEVEIMLVVKDTPAILKRVVVVGALKSIFIFY